MPSIRPPVQTIGLAANLFSAYVRQRSGDLASCSVDLFVNGQTEIADPGMTASVDQDVRRFQIAMDEPEHVRMVDGVGHFRDDLGQPRR